MIPPRIVALFCLTIIICVLSILVIEKFSDKKHIHIVIARYNEDLDWLCDEKIKKHLTNDSYKTSIYIYNKGVNNVTPKFLECYNNILDIHIIELPNVGRCDHTYLYHVIENYHHLPEAMIFIPASCSMNMKFAKAQYVIEKAYNDAQSVFVVDNAVNIYDSMKHFSLSSWMSSFGANKINKDASMELASPRPFGEWYLNVFGQDERHRTGITYLGILAVSGEHARQRDIASYRQIIRHVETHQNPEAGHYIERSWSAIFKIPEDRKFVM